MLSAFRDAIAAGRFFRKALKSIHNHSPNEIASCLGAGNPPMTHWTHRES